MQRDARGQAAEGGLLELVAHALGGEAHGADGVVEGDLLGAGLAAEGEVGAADGLDGAEGVALDAGGLDEAADGVARQAQVVLDADLGGLLDRLRAGAHAGRERARRHRARHPHLGHAAPLRRRDRRPPLVQHPDRRRRQQERQDVPLRVVADELHRVLQHRRDDPRRPVRRRRHDPPARRVGLVHCYRVYG